MLFVAPSAIKSHCLSEPLIQRARFAKDEPAGAHPSAPLPYDPYTQASGTAG